MSLRRRRGTFGAVVFALAQCALALPALSQPTTPATPPGNPAATGLAPALIVISDPPGATVLLQGAYEMIGTTPWTLTRNVSGVYQVEVRRPGYETWRSEVVVGTGATLSVQLSKKTRLRAFARSLIIPGWGQSYAGNRGKGHFFFFSELIALGGTIALHELYENEVDDFDDAAERYRSATKVEEIPALRAKMNARARDADRAYDRRQGALAVAAGIYALSALDALVLSPSPGDGGQLIGNHGGAPSPTLGVLAEPALAGESRVGLSVRW